MVHRAELRRGGRGVAVADRVAAPASAVSDSVGSPGRRAAVRAKRRAGDDVDWSRCGVGGARATGGRLDAAGLPTDSVCVDHSYRWLHFATGDYEANRASAGMGVDHHADCLWTAARVLGRAASRALAGDSVRVPKKSRGQRGLAEAFTLGE